MSRQLAERGRRPARPPTCASTSTCPVGTSGDGFDTWADHELYAWGCGVGAPPDDFFGAGQNWGFPPVEPVRRPGPTATVSWRPRCATTSAPPACCASTTSWASTASTGCPTACRRSEGVYVRYPADEMFAVLAVEASRRGCPVVGEDLGTVPDEVRDALDRYGIGGMYVSQFQLPDAPGRPIPLPHGRQVASLDTHDTPTFSAWWRGDDITLRHALGIHGEDQATDDRAPPRPRPRRLRGGAARRRGAPRRRRRARGARRPARAAGGQRCRHRAGGGRRPGPRDRPAERARHRIGPAELGTEATVRPPRTVRRPLDRARCCAACRGHDSPPTVGRRRRPDDRSDPDDLWLFNEGAHTRLYEQLGAHPGTDAAGVEGCWFGVWAPERPRGLGAVGDFNGWTPGDAPLAAQGDSGIWTGFVPGVGHGDRYKFHIESRADGYARRQGRPVRVLRRDAARAPPRWCGDLDATSGATPTGWPSGGDRNALDAPMSIYEMHLGSWRHADGRAAVAQLPRARRPAAPTTCSRMGFTHVEFLPLMEHPFYGSWGYQTTGYFAPTARFGTPQDLMFLIDTLHQARHRRDPRLGAVALPERRARPRLLRRHPPLRARRSAQGLPPRLEQR